MNPLVRLVACLLVCLTSEGENKMMMLTLFTDELYLNNCLLFMRILGSVSDW